jgi:cell division protein ZapB
MHAELDTLEAKIRQVAELCQSAAAATTSPCASNLLAAQQDNKQLNDPAGCRQGSLASAARPTLPEDE